MNKNFAVYVGLITGLAVVVANAVSFYVFHNPIKSDTYYVTMGLFIAGVTASVLAYKKTNNPNTGFKDFFFQGFKTFMIATLLVTIYTYIFYKMNPQIMEAFIEDNNKLIVQDGKHTAAEIPANTANLRKIFIPMTVAITLFQYLFLGALLSAIAAGFLSQKKSE